MNTAQLFNRKRLFLSLFLLVGLSFGSLIWFSVPSFVRASDSENVESENEQRNGGDKLDVCGLDVNKKCKNGRVNITVKITGFKPESCDEDITLKEKGGNVIKESSPVLKAVVDDERDRTLIVDHCCERDKVEISKGECSEDKCDPKSLTIDGPDEICGDTPTTFSVDTCCDVEWEWSGESKMTPANGKAKEVKIHPEQAENGTLTVKGTGPNKKCRGLSDSKNVLLQSELDLSISPDVINTVNHDGQVVAEASLSPPDVDGEGRVKFDVSDSFLDGIGKKTKKTSGDTVNFRVDFDTGEYETRLEKSQKTFINETISVAPDNQFICGGERGTVRFNRNQGGGIGGGKGGGAGGGGGGGGQGQQGGNCQLSLRTKWDTVFTGTDVPLTVIRKGKKDAGDIDFILRNQKGNVVEEWSFGGFDKKKKSRRQGKAHLDGDRLVGTYTIQVVDRSNRCASSNRKSVTFKKPELTVDRVPEYTFLDADFHMPIRSTMKISKDTWKEIDPSIDSVRVIKYRVTLRQDGENIFLSDADQGNVTVNEDRRLLRPFDIPFGIGDGTTENSNFSLSNKKQNKPFEELDLTGFWGIKKVPHLNEEDEKDIHLFSQEKKNNGREVPHFRVSVRYNVTYNVSQKMMEKYDGAKNDAGGTLVSEKEADENNQPKVFGDQHIPAVDLGEKTEYKSLTREIYQTNRTDVTARGKMEYRHAPNQTHFKRETHSCRGEDLTSFDRFKGDLANTWHETRFEENVLSLNSLFANTYGFSGRTRLGQINTALDDFDVNDISKKNLGFGLSDPVGGLYSVGVLDDLDEVTIGEVWNGGDVDCDVPPLKEKAWHTEVNRMRGYINGVRNGIFFFTSYGGWSKSLPFTSMDFNDRKAKEMRLKMGEVSLQGEINTKNEAFSESKSHTVDVLDVAKVTGVGLISAANPWLGVAAGTSVKIAEEAIKAVEQEGVQGDQEAEGILQIVQQQIKPDGSIVNSNTGKESFTTDSDDDIEAIFTLTSSERRIFDRVPVGHELRLFFEGDLYIGLKTTEDLKFGGVTEDKIKVELGILYESIDGNGNFKLEIEEE